MTETKCDQRIADLSTKDRKHGKDLFMDIWPNHNREENEVAYCAYYVMNQHAGKTMKDILKYFTLTEKLSLCEYLTSMLRIFCELHCSQLLFAKHILLVANTQRTSWSDKKVIAECLQCVI